MERHKAMSQVSQLALIISENVAMVENYFEEHRLPLPSYDIDGPPAIVIPPREKAVLAAHVAVLGATTELHNLMLGPKAMLMSQNVSAQKKRLEDSDTQKMSSSRSVSIASVFTVFIISTWRKLFKLAPRLPSKASQRRLV